MIRLHPYRVYGIIAALHVLTFCAAVLWGHVFLADSSGYLHQAYNLKHWGSWYAEDWYAPVLPDYFSFRTPLYAVFILLCQLVSDSVWPILIVQNILSCLSVGIVYQILKKWKLQESLSGIVLIASWILFPLQLFLSNMVMSEILFQFIILLLLQTCLRIPELSDKQVVWKTGLLLLLALLIKPVALLLSVPVLFLYGFSRYPLGQLKKRRTIFTLAGITLLPLVGIIGVGLQQKHQTGYFHFSSIRAITQQRYHARYVLANVYGDSYANQWDQECRIRYQAAPTYEERYTLMLHMGDSVLKKYPLTFVKLYVRGVAAFFLDPGRHELFVFFGWNTSQTGMFHQLQSKGVDAITDTFRSMPIGGLVWLLLNFVYNILAVIALIYFIANKEVPAYTKWVLLLFIAYFACTTGFLGVARYRSVIFPLLILVMGWVLHYRLQIRANES